MPLPLTLTPVESEAERSSLESSCTSPKRERVVGSRIVMLLLLGLDDDLGLLAAELGALRDEEPLLERDQLEEELPLLEVDQLRECPLLVLPSSSSVKPLRVIS